MNLQRRVLVITLACCVVVGITGCPSGGFFGRYIVLNSSDDTIHNLTISAVDQKKSRDTTAGGAGMDH